MYVLYELISYLVLAGPESADCQFYLVPLRALRSGNVPNWVSMWSTIHLHIDAEPAWTVAITAIQEVAELYTVGVIFT